MLTRAWWQRLSAAPVWQATRRRAGRWRDWPTRVGAWGRAGYRRWPRSAAALLVAAVALALVPKPPLLDGLRFSQAVYSHDGRLLRLTLSPDQKYRLRLRLAGIAPMLVDATLLHEDRYFRWHPGVNPAALLRAAYTTYGGGRRVGGSTISMQLARLRFDINSRTPLGKLEQILRALQIELHYSKDEVLEAYLNLAPYGGNIEGVGAASLVYFGKDADKLTLAEALTLSVIPQSPARRGPGADSADEDSALQQARAALLTKWLADHPADRVRAAQLAPALTTRATGELPFRAPHFVDAVLSDAPSGGRVVTTLDLGLQATLERGLRAYIERNRSRGLRNGTALLVDTRNMAVRALVGSADFFDDDIEGQVNGARARRSPGSALKPFIYALGLEQGIIHPLSLLKDTPTSFSGYNPENFDREFVGPVTARAALVRSRNVPAVYVASQLKQPSLYEFLQRAGAALPRDEAYYGLALVLGGAEISMEDLARWYAMLANGGILRPLRTLADQPEVAGERLLSEEASFLVLDMLKDNPRPRQGFRAAWTRDELPVYWKTGTSFAFRDAWAIGVVGPYVLAVWIGNFDGSGNPAFVGVEAAGPLLFELVDALRSSRGGLAGHAHGPHGNLARVDVCAVSGQLPGPHCRHTVETWFIPGTSPIRTCDVHRAVTVDVRSGLRSCARGGPGTRTEIYEFWPSDLLRLFRLAGVPRRTPPPDNPQCPLDERAVRGLAPTITSPQAGVTYSLRAAAAGKQTLGLTATTDADARAVYWFVDDRFVGKSGPSQPLFWTLRPGRYVVRAVDDHGRSDARDLSVAVVE